MNATSVILACALALSTVALVAVVFVLARALSSVDDRKVTADLLRKIGDRLIAEQKDKLEVLKLEQEAEVAAEAARSRHPRLSPGLPSEAEIAFGDPTRNGSSDGM